MTADRAIKGWTIEATCPTCAGLLAHIADGRPVDHTSRAVARCTSCGRTYTIQITIADASATLGRTLPASAGNHRPDCRCARCTNAAKTHCANGHEFTPANTYVRPNGSRDCRACKRQAKRESTARRVAAA